MTVELRHENYLERHVDVIIHAIHDSSRVTVTTVTNQIPIHKVFDLQILFDPVLGALAADARLLDAAERRDLVGDEAGVDADHAGLRCPRRRARCGRCRGHRNTTPARTRCRWPWRSLRPRS